VRKVIVFACLLLTIGIMIGCGSSTSTDTTTTTTTVTTTTLGPASGAASAAGTGASVGTTALLGIANIGSVVGNTGSITGAPSASSALGLRAATVMAFTIPVAPPDSFLASQEASWDGYLTVSSLHTGETVSIRFLTTGGAVINGAIFSAPTQKKIADISGINWDDLVSPETITTTMWSTGFSHWLNLMDPNYHAYQDINSMWDYLLWSTILPKVHTYAETIHAGLPAFSTPTATIEVDMMGGFQGTVTRDASATNYGVNLSFLGTMEYATYIDPAHEVPKSLTGEGTVTLPNDTVVALSMNLGFVTNESGGIIPSCGTMDWSFPLSGEAWSGTATLNGGDRTASGDVKKNGTAVGTLYLDASGGAVVTIEGVTYNVTNPL